MTININPPNFNGVSALAGNSSGGQLNLANPGKLGVEVLQLNQAQREAQQRYMIEQMRIRQQSEEALMQRGLLSQQQQPQIPRQLIEQLRTASIQQPGRPTQQEDPRKQFQEATQREMAKLVDEDKASIKEKGAFAAYTVQAMQQVKDPQEAQILRNEILKEAVARGYTPQEEADMAAKVPISQFINMAKAKLIQFGVVDDFNDMYGDKQSKSSSGSGVSELTPSVKSDAQKDLVQSQDNIRQLAELYGNVPDNYFGASALGQDVTAIREWAEGIPAVGGIVGPSAEDKAQLETYAKFEGKSQGLALQIIKQLSGVAYTDSQLEFLKNILPSIGKGTVKSKFNGRSEALFEWFNGIEKHRKQLLESDVDSEEYKESMTNYIAGSSPVENDNQKLRIYLKLKGHTDEQIEKALKGAK